MLYQLSYSRKTNKKTRPSMPPWWGKDSNLRRRKPADLQSAPVGHLGTPPKFPSDNRFETRSKTHPITQGRADGENRTRNLLITNQLLRQLSYVSKQRFFASLVKYRLYATCVNGNTRARRTFIEASAEKKTAGYCFVPTTRSLSTESGPVVSYRATVIPTILPSCSRNTPAFRT